MTDVRQDNYKRAEWRPQMFVYRLSPPPLSLPFPHYFFPKQRACSQAKILLISFYALMNYKER